MVELANIGLNAYCGIHDAFMYVDVKLGVTLLKMAFAGEIDGV